MIGSLNSLRAIPHVGKHSRKRMFLNPGSHVGIFGNVLADKTAKATLHSIDSVNLLIFQSH